MKAILVVLGDTEDRVITKVKALESGITVDEELNSGDHLWWVTKLKKPAISCW